MNSSECQLIYQSEENINNQNVESYYFNNNENPDDVLISQIFFKNNVQYYELENKKV